jgi:hypothetical protein
VHRSGSGITPHPQLAPAGDLLALCDLAQMGRITGGVPERLA